MILADEMASEEMVAGGILSTIEGGINAINPLAIAKKLQAAIVVIKEYEGRISSLEAILVQILAAIQVALPLIEVAIPAETDAKLLESLQSIAGISLTVGPLEVR